MAENLTPHFTLEEAIASDTAKALKISNIPTEAQKKVLKHTCEYLLEPLRQLLIKKYGECSIIITSGFRGDKLNTAVKGAKNSQHRTGEAFDIKVKVKKTGKIIDYTELYNNIKLWVKYKAISVDQAILEKSGQTWWVHVSYSAAGKTKNRNQFLKYNNGTYTLDKN